MIKLNFFVSSFSVVNQHKILQIIAFCTSLTYSFFVHKMLSVFLSFVLEPGTSIYGPNMMQTEHSEFKRKCLNALTDVTDKNLKSSKKQSSQANLFFITDSMFP